MTYPKYDIESRIMNGKRCTVTVTADTKCGPRIKAKATVTGLENETIDQLKAKTKEIALRNLSYEYDVVVNSCKSDGKHKGH